MIDRHNILDLIGQRKGKFNSCIITCYSFDFHFFEERLMPVLRASGIRNVNVLVDGNVLDNELESNLDAAFNTHRTYSLNKIYVKGAFHPKIILLTGIAEGMLIVGSGNITNAGLNTNDEIWGAFHISEVDGRNAPLFAEVWKYLDGFFGQVAGINSLKIDWVRDHSPWISKLKAPSKGFVDIGNDVEASFITNSKTNSIYSQLLEVVAKRRVETLTVISPYFDLNGQVIDQFLIDLSVKRLICIADMEFGCLPTRLSPKVMKKVEFYDWKDCIKKFDSRFYRLHAKAFHFDLGNMGEYLLLGSANATVNALGAIGRQAANGEAGIVLRRNKQSTFLYDLGITVSPRNLLKPEEIAKHRNRLENSTPRETYTFRILNAEIGSQRLAIYLREKTELNLEIVILGRQENELQSLVGKVEEGIIQVFIREEREICGVYLRRGKKRVSNIQLVHDVGRLSRTNPSSEYSELSQLIEAIASDPENNQYIELLRHVDYSWVDEELEQAGSSGKGNSISGPRSVTNEKHLTSKEFYTLPSKQQSEASLLTNPSLQIAEVLGQLSRGLLKGQRHFEESSEERLSQEFDSESAIPKDNSDRPYPVQIRGEDESRALERHWGRVSSFYEEQIDPLLSEKTLASAPVRPITLKDLSIISISLELMFIFCGRKYTFNRIKFAVQFEAKYSKEIEEIESKFRLTRLDDADPDFKGRAFYEVDPSLLGKVRSTFSDLGPYVWVNQQSYHQHTHFGDYLVEGVCNDEDSYGVKAYLVEMIDSFLICANPKAGQVKYEYDLLNEKVAFLRRSIFLRATFLCLNATWFESEWYRRDLLLLDLLNSIYPGQLSLSEIKAIKSDLDEALRMAHHKSISYQENANYYFKSMLPAFLSWKKSFESNRQSLNCPIASLRRNEIGFSSRIGFFVIRSSGKGFLVIEKPCFAWDDDLEGHVLRVAYPQASVVIFAQPAKP